MRLIICKNYDEMSVAAAAIVADVMKANPACVLGLATGSTPVGMYKKLIEMNRAGEIDFSAVTTVNLDEYYPISPDNDQSYRYFMNENLFNHVNIDKTRTFVPDGQAADPDAACEAYEETVASVRTATSASTSPIPLWRSRPTSPASPSPPSRLMLASSHPRPTSLPRL